MRRTMAPVSVVGVACGAVASERSREAQSLPILEEVFRYELQQFMEMAQEPAGTPVCLGIAEDKRIVDPPEDLMGRLGRGSSVLPESKCSGSTAARLGAGPIEWVSDAEVRVKGTFRSTARGSVPLLYRVVQESGKWRCLGPIIGYDPL